MFLKLEMPFFDKSVEGGTVVKWHKTEGDWINFGDDLFDIKVEEVTKLKRVKEGQATTVDMVKIKKTGLVLYIRVTSSDMGFLRQIQAPAGSEITIGDIVAAISIEEDEAMITADELAEAPAFRVLTNVAQEYAS